MDRVNHRASNGTAGYSRRLEEYRRAALVRFPGLSTDIMDGWFLPEADAVVLGLFLDSLPRAVKVLDLGSPDGLSALYLAGQRNVSEVICAGRDARIASESPDGHLPQENDGLLSISRSVLDGFREREKIRLPGDENVTDASGVPPSVALVRSAPTREGVREGLRWAFECNPGILALVSGCRGDNGPFVQAGMVDFLEDRRSVEIKALGELGPGLATSGLSLVFEGGSGAVEDALGRLAGEFSRRLDPLKLLSREEELIRISNRFRDEAEQTRRELAWMKVRNESLEEGYEKMRENNAALHEENISLNSRQNSVPRRLAGAVSRILRTRR